MEDSFPHFIFFLSFSILNACDTDDLFACPSTVTVIVNSQDDIDLDAFRFSAKKAGSSFDALHEICFFGTVQISFRFEGEKVLSVPVGFSPGACCSRAPPSPLA